MHQIDWAIGYLVEGEVPLEDGAKLIGITELLYDVACSQVGHLSQMVDPYSPWHRGNATQLGARAEQLFLQFWGLEVLGAVNPNWLRAKCLEVSHSTYWPGCSQQFFSYKEYLYQEGASG